MNAALALLPDFLLILLGLGLRQALRLGDHFWQGVEKLVYFVLFPALLFNALAKASLSWSLAMPLIMSGAATMVAGLLLAAMARRFSALSPMAFASQIQCAFRFNSYIGFAVAAKLHGTAGLAAMGLLTGAMVPLANLAAVSLLAKHGGQGIWRELLKNPLVLATVAGLAWNGLGWNLPVPVGQLLGRLAEAAIALGLLSVGAALRLRGISRGYGTSIWFLLVKLLGLPLVTILLAPVLGLTGIYADIALAWAALPAASSAYILAQRMGGDGPGVAWLISASTLAAMVTLPLWLA